MHASTKSVVVVTVFVMSVMSAGCSSSNLGQRLNVSIGITAVTDVTSTRAAIGRGAIEGNPLMGQSAVQQVVVKAAGTTAIIAMLQVLDDKHPVLANIMRASVALGWSFVSAHNASVAR